MAQELVSMKVLDETRNKIKFLASKLKLKTGKKVNMYDLLKEIVDKYKDGSS